MTIGVSDESPEGGKRGNLPMSSSLRAASPPQTVSRIPPEDLDLDRFRARVAGSGERQSREDCALKGQIKHMSLFSALQALSDHGVTGEWVIRAQGGSGSIFVERGLLVHVRFGRHGGPKAFFRLMALKEGSFEFFTPGRHPFERNIAGGLQSHLLEAARNLDELELARPQLPDATAAFGFSANTVAPVARIPYPVLEVMAAIHQHETLAGTLDGCGLPDLEIVRILVNLLKWKVIFVKKETTTPACR